MCVKKELLEILQDIKKNGPSVKSFGICANVHRALGNPGQEELKDLMAEWPKFSGRRAYPIGIEGIDPAWSFLFVKNYWDKETEYGRLRWELLDFLITMLEQELNQ